MMLSAVLLIFAVIPLSAESSAEPQGARPALNGPAPRLPDEIVEGTRKRYLDIFKRLTGRTLE